MVEREKEKDWNGKQTEQVKFQIKRKVKIILHKRKPGKKKEHSAEK